MNVPEVFKVENNDTRSTEHIQRIVTFILYL